MRLDELKHQESPNSNFKIMSIKDASDAGFVIISLSMVGLIECGAVGLMAGEPLHSAKVMRDPEHGLYGVATRGPVAITTDQV